MDQCLPYFSKSTKILDCKSYEHALKVEFKNIHDIIFTIHFSFDNDVMVMCSNDSNDSQHLVNTINKNVADHSLINDIITFIDNELDYITYYCVGCNTKVDFQSQSYITCGQNKCMYKFEELLFGNVICDKIKSDKDLLMLNIITAFAAIKSPNRNKIFEPFPIYFLNDKKIMNELYDIRGTLSSLLNVDHSNYKNFGKLLSLVDNFDITYFFEKLDKFCDDGEILNYFGKEIYILLRFIVSNSKINIAEDNIGEDIGSIKIYKLYSPYEIEKDFNINNEKTIFLYHGSPYENWYSILRNGLKICSGTKLQLNGSAYGKGIYFSDSISFSEHYSKKRIVNDNNSNINKYEINQIASQFIGKLLGVFEIVGKKDDYYKSNNIFVVNKNVSIIQRYLLIIPNKKVSADANKNLNNFFNINIYDIDNTNNSVNINNVNDNNLNSVTINKKGINKIIKDYKMYRKNNDKSYEFIIDTQNISNAKLLIKFNENDLIHKQMKNLYIDHIELHVYFPCNYPYHPPFIMIYKPRFQRHSGHITAHGALCMEILTPNGWSSAVSFDNLIQMIKFEILDGEGKIDSDNYAIPYDRQEAQKSFIIVAKGHGWI